MKKEAFRRGVVGTLRHAKRILQTSPRLTGTLAGSGIGAAYGGAVHAGIVKVVEHVGSPSVKKKREEYKKKHPFLSSLPASMAMGAISGGLAGNQIGTDVKHDRECIRGIHRATARATARFRRRSKKWAEDFGKNWNSDFFGGGRYGGGEAGLVKTPNLGLPSWLKGISSKIEAKSAYKAQALKHHPDRGGSAEKMKNINQEWESFKKHHFDKLSMVFPSFFDELMEIRNAPSR
jgi:hypothetical protein